MAYDPNGFLLTVTGAIPGSTTAFTYDAVGRVKTTTDSEGYTVTNSYDNLNRLTQQTFPDGTSRLTAYADMQNLLSEHYAQAFGFPSLPFTFRSGIKINFGGESWGLK